MIYTYLKNWGDSSFDIEFQTTSKKVFKEYLKENKHKLYGSIQAYCTKKNEIYFTKSIWS